MLYFLTGKIDNNDDVITMDWQDRFSSMAPDLSELLTCPNCCKHATFLERSSIAVEPHGEMHEDVWLECSECGAATDEVELRAANEEANVDAAGTALQEVA